MAVDGKSVVNISFALIDKEDIESVFAIEQTAQSHPMSRSIMLSCFSKRYFNAQMIVDGQVAGFYIGEFVADESSLIEICVAPDFQGKGLGKMLLEHYIAAAKEKGAMSCWLEVRESNIGARTLYQRLDFNEVDVRRNYYPTASGHEDAIIMSYFIF